MVNILIQWLIVTAVLMALAYLIRDIKVKSFGSALIAAAVLGVLNAVLKPILVFLTFPITFVTFGLFLLVINALILYLVSALCPDLRSSPSGPRSLPR